MDERVVLKAACAMPLTNPSYPPGPYRFIDREYMIIVYRTDSDALHRVVPEPLEVVEPIVKYEFIRMPNSTGFGDYTESGQVIPVRFRGEVGGVLVHHASVRAASTRYEDSRVVTRGSYRYAVRPYDLAGHRGPMSDAFDVHVAR